jgi:hypothetical protein
MNKKRKVSGKRKAKNEMFGLLKEILKIAVDFATVISCLAGLYQCFRG